jgi:hypothetical protein
MSPAAAASRSGGNTRWGSRRTRLLAGGFLLVFCAWSVDTLGQERGPKKAVAAQASPAAGAFVIADPPDRAALDRFLADGEPHREALVLEATRDPFAVPAGFAIAGAAPHQPAESQPAEEAISASPAPAAAVSDEKSFADVHHLQGVILGARPLALIDGNGYRVGDWIDGYRIVALSRNTAELVGRDGRVVLRVAAPDLKAVRSSP